MPNIDLTQTDLNASLRGLSDVDIMMFLPDKNIYFPSNAVTVNKQALPYASKLQSIIEMTSLPQANIATFENNSWILDGSFISPSKTYGGGGDSYTGYISNDMTDDEGNYETNPILTINFSLIATVNYISIQFAGGIDTSYPKTFKIRTFNDDSLINEHDFNINEQTGLPLLVAQIGDANVNKVEFEFVGTVCPHRRSRLNKILFGKVEQIDPYYLQSWSVDDKVSLVADSIPTKTFEYTVINYDGDYNVDNPRTKLPDNFNDVQVFFTFSMEVNGLWKYAPTKVFNLMDILSTAEGLVTFNCGSILDILTTTYDHDIYTGKRTIETIMNSLLSFSDIGTDQCILNSFANYEINVPLPEAPVREIIQRLAFSSGATLVVTDDNKIMFSEKKINPNSSTTKFMFNRPIPFESAAVILEEPHAEALDYTTNIAMYEYDTIIENEASSLGTMDISSTIDTRISYSVASEGIQIDIADEEQQNRGLVSIIEGPYSQHAIIRLNYSESDISLPIKIEVRGRKAVTTQTIPKGADKDTLMLDSGLTLTVPNNLKVKNNNRDEKTFYYTDWYGAKFKYKFKTRNEFLVKAGDIIYFETPFTNGQPTKIGYVLRNSYSDNNESGEMEVITLA